MNFVSITFQNIKTEIENYLKTQHNKGNILFSPASPYGQILSVYRVCTNYLFFILRTQLTNLT